MKILIVHNFYKLPGGEDTVVRNEKRMLESHGHRVILYTRDNKELDNMSRVKKLLLPFCSVFNMRTFFDVRRILKKEKPDVVHVHNTLALVSPAVYYAAFSVGIPVVQTVHNFRLLCPGASFFRNGHVCEECVSKGLMCSVKHKCYRNSTLQTLASAFTLMIHRALGTYKKLNYICLTPFNKEKLLKLKGVDEDKIFVKPHFTGNVEIEGSRSYSEKPYYVYIGRLEKIKGSDILLKAWENLGKDAPDLYLFGSGDMDERCKSFAEKNNLTNVIFKGHTDHDELMKICKSARALIFPSVCYEGFGMTIIEAYSLGVPVIAGDFGNGGSLVKEGKTGFKYKYNSPEALADTVRKAESLSDDSREVLSKLAYKEYKDYYCEEANYKKLLEIYSSVIKK